MGGNSGGGGSTDVPGDVAFHWDNLAHVGDQFMVFATNRAEHNPYTNSPYLKADSLNMGTAPDAAGAAVGYGNVFVHDDISDSFFGAGLVISSYDSLYGMFKEFITDVDINTLYDTIASDALTNAHISTDISAESAYLDDEINQVSLPKINAGNRDINAVMTTGFTNAKAVIESQKLKMVNKYSATMKTKSLDIATARWSETLKWNLTAVESYMQLNKLYWLSYYDNVDADIKVRVDHKKWPFTIMDFQRGFVGAAAGAGGSAGAVTSPGAKAASGALAGGAIGYKVSGGNPYVTAAGAIVGGIAGYLN